MEIWIWTNDGGNDGTQQQKQQHGRRRILLALIVGWKQRARQHVEERVEQMGNEQRRANITTAIEDGNGLVSAILYE